MKLIDLLSSNGYIVVNKGLLRILGAEGSVLFGELCAEYQFFAANNKLEADGSFYSTTENVEVNTGIKRRRQSAILSELQERGLIEIQIKGMPAQRHIRFNEDAVSDFITKCTNGVYSLDETPNKFGQNAKQVCTFPPIQFGVFSPSSLDDSAQLIYTTTKSNHKIKNNKLNNNNIYLTESSDSASESSIRHTSKEFEELWKLYPRKEGKQKALAAYSAAVKQGVTFETVNDGIERYKRHIAAKHIEPRYIKQGSTWFNGRCWQDEYNDESTTEYESSFDTDEFFKSALEANYGKGYFDDD